VKSLWSGALFFIAATWVDRRRVTMRWLLIALVLALMLFAVNLVRVAVLVVAGQVMGWQLLAEMIHLPLGVLGFIAVCAPAVALLSWQPSVADKYDSGEGRERVRPVWLSPALAAVIVAMALVCAPRTQVGLAQATPTWQFPGDLITQAEPLKPDDIAWLTRDGADSADRFRFEWRHADGRHSISGSLMLITSETWRAQHRPERCFEVYGLSLNASRVHLVAPDFPLRFVSLGDDDGRDVASASYWFQSAERTTSDYGTRIWADLSPERDRWVLVTILFDGVRDPRDTELEPLYGALHGAVARNLKER
jgi:exosortase O